MLRFVVQWLIPIALAIFAWVDCLLTPRPYVRLLPKPVWAVLIAVPYLGALLWIFSGRAAQPHEPRRRATDRGSGLFGSLGRPGSHQARPRVIGTGRAQTPGRGIAPGGWTVPPDDDPEFLRKLAEQLKRDRPET
ncbi:PLDc N-terminal domain-containing protein [Catenulispora subtropica]|uniref:PLD nuclease N-terminal domain-containing protein n=1 Tax=Catenulispora subtropica TaxID=450798 RepID=A0ABP5DH91_9ACTN